MALTDPDDDRRAAQERRPRIPEGVRQRRRHVERGSILDLFANDAQVYFPKWGLATGKDEIGKMFGDIGSTLKSIVHHYSALQLDPHRHRHVRLRGHEPR